MIVVPHQTHPYVVHEIERRVSTMLDGWTNSVAAEFVAEGLPSVRINSGQASAFSTNTRKNTSSRTNCEDHVIRQLREANLFENAWHFAEQVDRPMVGLPQFGSQCMEREHSRVGEFV